MVRRRFGWGAMTYELAKARIVKMTKISPFFLILITLRYLLLHNLVVKIILRKNNNKQSAPHGIKMAMKEPSSTFHHVSHFIAHVPRDKC